MKQLRKRLTYANVMSSIAVFLVLGGATAIAAGQLAKNSVGANQLKKNAVTAVKVKNNAINGAKIANNAVGTTKIANEAVTGEKIKESSLSAVPNATNAVNATNATNATNAANLNTYVPFGITYANAGESKPLVSYGPFSLVGQCAVDGLNLEANVIFATSEEHTSFGGSDVQGGDIGPATPETQRTIENPGASSNGAAVNSDGTHDEFNAQTLSGTSWVGSVESWVSKDAGQCRWSGFALKTS